jgi:hypothetical protein
MRALLLVVCVLLAAGCGPGSSEPAGGGSSSGRDGSVSAPAGPPTRGVGQRPAPVLPQPGPPGTPVSPIRLQVGIADSGPYADVDWWGGVGPCTVARPPQVGIDGSRITIRVTEAAGRTTAVCPELAMLKRTRVDLGPLPSGTYTVVAGRRSARLTVP